MTILNSIESIMVYKNTSNKLSTPSSSLSSVNQNSFSSSGIKDINEFFKNKISSTDAAGSRMNCHYAIFGKC